MYCLLKLEAPPALAISVRGTAVRAIACTVHLHTAQPCPASCTGDAAAMQESRPLLRHAASRTTQLHLASRGISRIRAARLDARDRPQHLN